METPPGNPWTACIGACPTRQSEDPRSQGGRPEGCRLSPTKPRRSTVPAGSPSSPSSPSQLPTSHPPTSHASFDAGGLLVWTGLWRSQNGRPKGLSSPTSTPDPASRSVFLWSSDYIPIKDQRPFNWSDPPLIGTRPLSYLPSHRPLGFLGVLALAAIISTGISDDNVPRPSPVPVPWSSSSSSKIATNNIAFFLSSPAPDSDASRAIFSPRFISEVFCLPPDSPPICLVCIGSCQFRRHSHHPSSRDTLRSQQHTFLFIQASNSSHPNLHRCPTAAQVR